VVVHDNQTDGQLKRFKDIVHEVCCIRNNCLLLVFSRHHSLCFVFIGEKRTGVWIFNG